MIRSLWRLARAVGHAMHGLAIVLFRFPALDRAAREARIRWWSARMLQVLGLTLRVDGEPRPGAKLLVANHVSWLDIMAVHAACPEARFVSKADVRHWPLANRLVDAARTLYLERERKRDAVRVVKTMTDALAAGDTVAVFPEGTTGDGHALLPFHANLLQAALAAGVPVQPLALRFSDRRHAVSPAAEFVGDTTLAVSLWRIASADGLAVRVQWLPAQPSDGDRRQLAQRLRAQIEQALSGRPAADQALP